MSLFRRTGNIRQWPFSEIVEWRRHDPMRRVGRSARWPVVRRRSLDPLLQYSGLQPGLHSLEVLPPQIGIGERLSNNPPPSVRSACSPHSRPANPSVSARDRTKPRSRTCLRLAPHDGPWTTRIAPPALEPVQTSRDRVRWRMTAAAEPTGSLVPGGGRKRSIFGLAELRAVEGEFGNGKGRGLCVARTYLADAD